ncbi:unnamed protein product, partial [Ectocarpus sp. 12 AP-2014]
QLQTRGCTPTTSTARAITTSIIAVSPACHPRHAFALASRIAGGNDCTRKTELGKGSRARFGTRRAASGHTPLQFQVGDSSFSSRKASHHPGARMHHPQDQRRFLRGSGQHFPHSDQVQYRSHVLNRGAVCFGTSWTKQSWVSYTRVLVQIVLASVCFCCMCMYQRGKSLRPHEL